MNGKRRDTGISLPRRSARRKIIRAAVFCAAFPIAWFLSCARQGFPPGGSEDKTPPEVVATVPLQHAVNVPVGQAVTIEFSEPVNEKGAVDNLFIVPIPARWPEVTWKSGGRIVTLRFPAALRTNATYVITIGSKTVDRQNNPMKDSYILAFSTGETIESGRIRGRVIPYHWLGKSPENVAGVDVAAYRVGEGAPSDSLSKTTGSASHDPDPRTDVPDYATQTNSDGTFTLNGLSNARYRLFAIGDRDRNGFYTVGEDMIGVAPDDVILAAGDSLALAPQIAVSEADTAMVQLMSVRPLDRNRIEVFFDREIDPAHIEMSIEGCSIAGWFVPSEDPKRLIVATSDQEEGKKYPIAALNVVSRDGVPLAPTVPQVFPGTARADTAALEITDWRPKTLAPGHDSIRLVFNRVLAVSDTAKHVIGDASGEDILVERAGPNVLLLAPRAEWKENTAYLVSLNREEVRGAGGNRLTGPGAQLAFRVVPSDTLGTIGGTITDTGGRLSGAGNRKGAAADAVYRLAFRHLETETERKLEVKGPSSWSAGPVLPGRYVAYGFRDDDGDGKVGRGSVAPFRAAEPAYAVPDTITVVSRRTTDSIQFIFR
jgi:hypothetical protein